MADTQKSVSDIPSDQFVDDARGSSPRSTHPMTQRRLDTAAPDDTVTERFAGAACLHTEALMAPPLQARRLPRISSRDEQLGLRAVADAGGHRHRTYAPGC